MPDQVLISLFVKLSFWEIYRLNVLLTATVLRKLLHIWGFVALLWLALSALLLFRPSHGQDWAAMMQNASPLKWVLGLPVLFVLVLPLLTAQRVLRDEWVKRGGSYQFSNAGIHLETSVSKTDLAWAAIRRVTESPSVFLIFTNPNIASMVPKRCVESAQGTADLRELFRTHVPNAKLRRD